MAEKIQLAHDATGATLYALVRKSDGTVVKQTDNTSEAYVTANLGNYDFPMTEQGTASRYYTATFPAVAAGTYAVAVYQQLGANPAETDTLLDGGNVEWDGSAVVPLSTRSSHTAADVWAGATRTLTAFSFSVTVGTNNDKAGYSLANGSIAAATFAANAIDANAIAADAIGSSELAASAVTEIQAGLSTLDAAGVRTAVGLASANLDTQLGAIAGYIDTEVGAIKAKTDNLPASPAAVGSAMTLTAGERDAAADALLARNVAGGSSAGRLVKEALAALRNKVAFDVPGAGQFTVYATDDATPLWTGTYTATPGAAPVTTLDPG
jgi:hypothetical protein